MNKIKSPIELMKSKHFKILDAVQVNENYILAIYEGKLSDYDILIKYKEKRNSKWSRLRTPKHIHWTVDMLIKQYSNPECTQNLIDFLLLKWDKIKGIQDTHIQKNILKNVIKIKIPKKLSQLNYGIYDIEFLFRLAFLLMIQEKTNRSDAYMFKKLLESLREKKDLFKIISIATHH